MCFDIITPTRLRTFFVRLQAIEKYHEHWKFHGNSIEKKCGAMIPTEEFCLKFSYISIKVLINHFDPMLLVVIDL